MTYKEILEWTEKSMIDLHLNPEKPGMYSVVGLLVERIMCLEDEIDELRKKTGLDLGDD